MGWRGGWGSPLPFLPPSILPSFSSLPSLPPFFPPFLLLTFSLPPSHLASGPPLPISIWVSLGHGWGRPWVAGPHGLGPLEQPGWGMSSGGGGSPSEQGS